MNEPSKEGLEAALLAKSFGDNQTEAYALGYDAATAKLREENEGLTSALKIYARRYHANGDCWNWRNYVCDSFSGECAHFDWEGAEQEEAWEIAEKALSPPSEAEQQTEA